MILLLSFSATTTALPSQQPTVVTSSPTPYCGESCNKTIIISSSTENTLYEWASNNWGISDYPDDCYCNLHVEVSFLYFVSIPKS